MRVYLYLLLRA